MSLDGICSRDYAENKNADYEYHDKFPIIIAENVHASKFLAALVRMKVDRVHEFNIS